ncbi:hypothetical protein CK203_032813 [Vitis vinifera]|uniref:Uncharacterized protein n=1 Tax=Vitis vinifera TaxID=29760 RepID=A0A438I8L5_VITVI|nr:hypothetical protein CK203_032813 [Vitis vinifera]
MLEKSELIPVSRVENVEELVDEFGYKVGKLPSTYLGMLLGAPFKCVAAWDGIEEKIQKEIGYVETSIPMMVRIRLEKIQRDFLWGGGALEQKPHLVRALLGKWVWCFANERKALWNQVIRGKYGEERGGWRSCETKEAYGVGLWKAISKMGHLVTPSFGFEVGDGKKFGQPRGKGGGSWNPCFNRPFNDWEMEEVERLFCCLEGKKVRVDVEDRVKWMESKDGVFSPKLSFFCVGGFLRESSNLGSLAKERVSWVFPLSVKETLLGWRGSFVGKKRKVAWQLGLLSIQQPYKGQIEESNPTLLNALSNLALSSKEATYLRHALTERKFIVEFPQLNNTGIPEPLALVKKSV